MPFNSVYVTGSEVLLALDQQSKERIVDSQIRYLIEMPFILVCALVASPAFLYVVHALGFKVAGIKAGSWAARIMAGKVLLILDYGGFVPSGSFCATLQSIGAGGLSAKANLAISAIGAYVGFLITKLAKEYEKELARLWLFLRQSFRFIIPAWDMAFYASMGNGNSVPIISQVKSAIQAIAGDTKGALETQEDFSKKCILVSQIRSLVELSLGDPQAALNTQISYAKDIDAIPILSQIKSGVYAACGDKTEALRVQEQFSKECLVVSQVRSAVEAAQGDFDGATQTQKDFLNGPGLQQFAIVGSAVAAPLAVIVTVGALGFTAGGIAAGSAASGMMAGTSF